MAIWSRETWSAWGTAASGAAALATVLITLFMLPPGWYNLGSDSARADLQRVDLFLAPPSEMERQAAKTLEDISNFGARSLAENATAALALDDVDAAMKWLLELAQEKENTKDFAGTSAVYRSLGILESLRSTSQSISYYKKAVAIDQSRTDYRLELGQLLIRSGNYEEAETELRRVLADSSSDDRRAAALVELGILRWRANRLSEAEKFLDEVDKVRDYPPLVQAKRLGVLGLIYRGYGKDGEHDAYERAIKYHEKSLAIFDAIHNHSGYATQLGNIGVIHRHLGNLEEAERCSREALGVHRGIDNQEGVAGQLQLLGFIANTRHHQEGGEEYLVQAEKLHKEALQVDRRIERKWGIALNLMELGKIYKLQERHDDARHSLSEALGIYEQLGLDDRSAEARLALANL